MQKLKNDKIKIALWYEDHIVDYGPNWTSNLNLIEKNNELIDNYFITTHPSVIKSKIKKNKLIIPYQYQLMKILKILKFMKISIDTKIYFLL